MDFNVVTQYELPSQYNFTELKIFDTLSFTYEIDSSDNKIITNRIMIPRKQEWFSDNTTLLPIWSWPWRIFFNLV